MKPLAFRVPAAIIALGLGILPLALSTAGQQPAKVSRIGLFHVGLDHVPPSLEGLREGMKALGYEEGKNIRLDWRNLADEGAARETAQAFVRDRVDLIVAFEGQTVRAAKAATSYIPILFLHVTDPVKEGFAKSLSRPGGNLTGFYDLFGDLLAKRIELLKELVPRLRRLLVLVDPQDLAMPQQLAEVRKAGQALRLQLVEQEVAYQTDLERVFGSIKPGDVQGVFVASPILVTNFFSLIPRLAAARNLPLPASQKGWVERGALFSYGPNFDAMGREAARYVDKILKGTKPADLPVEQVSRLELVVNLKTAKALGLTIPPSILVRADQVIQ